MGWRKETNKDDTQKGRHAIVFVHGLNGSSKTWSGNSSNFIDRLKSENELNEEYDIFIFEYYTKVLDSGFLRRILSIIPGLKKIEFNVGIRRIAMVLRAHLDDVLKKYKSIVLVSHSMGGLIVKRSLLELSEEQIEKIPLFLSLSVPHNGAVLANIGTLIIGDKIQIVNLEHDSEFIIDLTNSFHKLKNKPRILYQVGNQDKIVSESSAIPVGVDIETRIDTDDNHYSVLKIDDPEGHIPYSRLIQELKDILKLDKQQSQCHKANNKIHFVISNNWSFLNVSNAIVKTVNCTIEYIGFNKNELNFILPPRELTAINAFQALEKLGYIADGKIPKYEVSIKECHFQITKIK